MLIVLATAKLGDGAFENAHGALKVMIEASNAEDGCISYAYSQDVLDPSIMQIVEIWQDEAALAAHFQTPHMAAFQQALGTYDIQLIKGLKYQADDGAPLM